jgi:hypothetical protein
MNRARVNVQIYYIYYFNNSKTCRVNALRNAPGPAIETIVRFVPRVRSFGCEAVQAAKDSRTIPRRLLLRMCNLKMTTTLASGGIWAVPGKSAFPR